MMLKAAFCAAFADLRRQHARDERTETGAGRDFCRDVNVRQSYSLIAVRGREPHFHPICELANHLHLRFSGGRQHCD
jgi:hypothetical protein